MREIKFRAWGPNSRKWLDWSAGKVIHLVDGDLDTIFTLQPVIDGGWLCCQYTGLNDANDSDIYEGVICRVTDRNGDSRLQQMFALDHFDFYASVEESMANREFPEEYLVKLDRARGYDVEAETYLIVGNIYENLNLLRTA